jgi:NAD(P)-dependent dehydrogenase (short-subunit alcohol dehydrogenase family)
VNSIVWFFAGASGGFGLGITRAALDRGNAVVAAMRARREGRIVNLSSVGGFTATPVLGVYAATKLAVEALSEAMHAELRPLGIDVITGSRRLPHRLPRSDLASTRGAYHRRLRVDVRRGREWAAVTNHAQCGDRTKAAATIIEVATTPSPPLRLHLGADSVSRIEAKIHHVTRELIQWRALAVSTGDPGPADDGAS